MISKKASIYFCLLLILCIVAIPLKSYSKKKEQPIQCLNNTTAPLSNSSDILFSSTVSCTLCNKNDNQEIDKDDPDLFMIPSELKGSLIESYIYNLYDEVNLDVTEVLSNEEDGINRTDALSMPHNTDDNDRKNVSNYHPINDYINSNSAKKIAASINTLLKIRNSTDLDAHANTNSSFFQKKIPFEFSLQSSLNRLAILDETNKGPIGAGVYTNINCLVCSIASNASTNSTICSTVYNLIKRKNHSIERLVYRDTSVLEYIKVHILCQIKVLVEESLTHSILLEVTKTNVYHIYYVSITNYLISCIEKELPILYKDTLTAVLSSIEDHLQKIAAKCQRYKETIPSQIDKIVSRVKWYYKVYYNKQAINACLITLQLLMPTYIEIGVLNDVKISNLADIQHLDKLNIRPSTAKQNSAVVCTITSQKHPCIEHQILRDDLLHYLSLCNLSALNKHVMSVYSRFTWIRYNQKKDTLYIACARVPPKEICQFITVLKQLKYLPSPNINGIKTDDYNTLNAKTICFGPLAHKHTEIAINWLLFDSLLRAVLPTLIHNCTLRITRINLTEHPTPEEQEANEQLKKEHSEYSIYSGTNIFSEKQNTKEMSLYTRYLSKRPIKQSNLIVLHQECIELTKIPQSMYTYLQQAVVFTENQIVNLQTDLHLSPFMVLKDLLNNSVGIQYKTLILIIMPPFSSIHAMTRTTEETAPVTIITQNIMIKITANAVSGISFSFLNHLSTENNKIILTYSATEPSQLNSTQYTSSTDISSKYRQQKHTYTNERQSPEIDQNIYHSNNDYSIFTTDCINSSKIRDICLIYLTIQLRTIDAPVCSSNYLACVYKIISNILTSLNKNQFKSKTNLIINILVHKGADLTISNDIYYTDIPHKSLPSRAYALIKKLYSPYLSINLRYYVRK
ncbi:hypothetical protein NEOKW01_1823 [Nematocida sp. AWRm80]|nr:hypothetical protein NEOKW01_1823 [Nematocida sp. AWRm80]